LERERLEKKGTKRHKAEMCIRGIAGEYGGENQHMKWLVFCGKLYSWCMSTKYRISTDFRCAAIGRIDEKYRFWFSC